MEIYSGSKESTIRVAATERPLFNILRGGITKNSYTDPDQTVYASGGIGRSFPLAHVSGSEGIQKQREEIDEIYNELCQLDFVDVGEYAGAEEHNPDFIEMTKGGIQFSMGRRERREELHSTGIKNRKQAIIVTAVTCGLYGLLSPQYTEWDGLISELDYSIKAEGTAEEQAFASDLDRKLREKYQYSRETQ